MSQSIALSQDEQGHLPALDRNLNVLMVWPRFQDSFWSFRRSMPILGKRAALPPLGLVTVAALCPQDWSLRLIDETVEQLQDADILWADLVMVSGMEAQREGIHHVLQRTRCLGRRTIVGGPYASSEPDVLLEFADHVVVGEPDEVFDQIARDLEHGSAKRLYEISEKPDVSKTPIPRFDLLKASAYVGMAVQFSRGCPFQCEFCDIITIYGRKPRTKSAEQLIAEIDALYRLGWRQAIFIVDDNFIGNRKRALDLVIALKGWQEAHSTPFQFFTEASVNLSQCPDLLEAMVSANFTHVFMGIESPSAESLTETKKLQNLREDLGQAIRHVQSEGLWIMGGFIVGFDSDTEGIFQRQVEFITESAIPFALVGMLQAPLTTALYHRMVKEGRIRQSVDKANISNMPNFLTRMPLPVLARGYQNMLRELFDPDAYFERGLHSLQRWQTRSAQKSSELSMRTPGIVLRSLWYQGIRSSYRRAYWRFLWQLLRRWTFHPSQLGMGFVIMVFGHHLMGFAAEVATNLDREIPRLEQELSMREELASV